jgi:small subunit ribosomal protein S4
VSRRRQRRQSEYGKQLVEKQQAKRLYGLRERQFRQYFERAAKTKEATGERLLQLLETRLDNVVFRLGYGKSRKQARQLVSHGHVRLNDRRVTIPSQGLKAGDAVRVTLETVELGDGEVPGWLTRSKRDLGGSLANIPTRGEIPLDVNEQLIVEFYSR